jgi:hypothetical protein
MRLINADALKDDIKSRFLTVSKKRLLCRIIDKAPTVEQRPQGEWIFVSRNCWKCPCCQELTNEGKNFCPNCGADMRGEEC